MTFSAGLFRGALVLLAGLALSGCLRSAPSQLDEGKESHFLLGRSRVSAMDYEGGIESFGKALEVNPKSASAHFELASLFEQREVDPAAAIYHYEQYLKLRPKADNAEFVTQHILALKKDLARTVSFGPVTEKQQREIERLAEQNGRLREENRRLSEEVEKWRAGAMGIQVLTNQPGATSLAVSVVKPVSPGQPPSRAPAASDTITNGPPPVMPATIMPATIKRTHTVKAGETAARIARRYGVKLEALRAANPRLDPRRLRPGQTLNIPAANF